MSQNYLWVDEEWSWFPDGDESRAMTRVYIGSHLRDMEHGTTVGFLQTLLSEVCQFIEEKEGGFDSSKISIYGKSVMRNCVAFMYERPATPEEVGRLKTQKIEETASRIASLREEIAKLEEKS